MLTTPPKLPSTSRTWAAGLLLLVIAFIVYWPALRGEFQWDDDEHITANANLASPAGLLRTWTVPDSNIQYYPLSITAFWLEYQLFGAASTLGYHIVNLLFHAFNAFLLWQLLKRARVPWPFLAALLFVIHPVMVETVAWISELKTILSATFYLLATLAWLRWRDTRHPAWYAAIVAAFLAAMLCKAVVCTFPAAMVLLEFWLRSRQNDRPVSLKTILLGAAPLLILGLAMAALFAWLERHHVGASGSDFAFSPLDRLLIAGRAGLFYLRKFAWPWPILTIYPRWQIDPHLWWQYLYPLGLLLLLLALWQGRKKVGIGPFVAIALCLLTVAPALGFINFYPMVFSFVANHYAYLALAPLCALAAAILHCLTCRRSAPEPASALPAVALLIALVLIPISAILAARWQTRLSLWAPTVAANPASPFARSNYAQALLETGHFTDALQQARSSLQLRADNSRPWFTIGAAQLHLQNPDAASDALRRGLQLEPGNADAWFNFGIALEKLGDHAGSEDAFDHALNGSPPQPRAWDALLAVRLNLARAQGQRGDVQAAIAAYQRLIHQSPRPEFEAELRAYLAMVAQSRPASRP